MITIDNLLLQIENYGFENFTSSISRRDLRILRNLANLVKSSNFITENQGKLLIKLLTENFKHLNFLGSKLSESLDNPYWSREFRNSDDPKKITILSSNDEKLIKIETNCTSYITKIIAGIEKNGGSDIHINNNKIVLMPLLEKNLILTVDAFKPENFDISNEILEFYKTIKSWSREEVASKFQLETLDNKKILNKLEEDLGLSSATDELLFADRKIRYQYQFSPKFEPNTLKEIIAHRTSNKVFVESTKYEFEELIDSLAALKKLPILLVFSNFSESECLKQMDMLSAVLTKKNLADDVGIYFRFKNVGKGQDFNQRIADKKFNKPLDANTKIAGVLNGKIAKFFLKTDWQPNSVITFTNSLRNNKTAVYCNNCDLIVYYTDKLPFIIST
jgi:hypothetical protein